MADRDNPKRNKSGAPGGKLADAPEDSAYYRSGNPDFALLVKGDPHVVLERGEVLFSEGDPPTCMYIVRTGALQIRLINHNFYSRRHERRLAQ